jgi:glycosyltransferase involved in cell wall biosynthesis
MKGMRVLIYSHAFAPRIGGIETSAMLLARGLAGKGLSVVVATPTPADGFVDADLPFKVLRQPTLRELWRWLGWADVVHLAGPALAPLILSLLRHRPTVVEHHGYQAVCPNGLLLYEPTKTACPGYFMARKYHECLRCNARTVGWRRSIRMLLLTFPRRWLCLRTTVHSAVSGHVAGRLRLPRTRVIYHGIPDPGPLDGEIPTNPLTFAYVGRLVREKGLPLLLEAARQLRREGYRFRLKFIGDGPEREPLEELTDRYGLEKEVIFTGFRTGPALEEVMADVTCVVMPSVWEETAGLAAMEQMMRGRLVIVADIGGLGEVVDRAGLKFPPGDATALADCMRRVLNNPSLAREIGGSARERALTLFSWDRMVKNYERLYLEILEERVENGG